MSHPPAPSRQGDAKSSAEAAEVELQWKRLKAFVVRQQERHIALGPIRADDLLTFFQTRMAIESAVASGIPEDRVARERGFASAEHWTMVVSYIEALHSELYIDGFGKRAIRFVAEYRSVEALADRERTSARLRAAEERLFEPIQGVTLERFAALSAAISTLGREASRADLSRVLAQYGTGPASYGAVRRGWFERMAQDATHQVQRRYAALLTARDAPRIEVRPLPPSERPKAAMARGSWADLGLAELAEWTA